MASATRASHSPAIVLTVNLIKLVLVLARASQFTFDLMMIIFINIVLTNFNVGEGFKRMFLVYLITKIITKYFFNVSFYLIDHTRRWIRNITKKTIYIYIYAYTTNIQ